MIYPTSFDQKTGFSQVRRKLADLCLSDLGREKVEEINFSSDYQSITRMLDETAQMKEVLLGLGNFPAQDYYDLKPELTLIRLPGSMMEAESLMRLKLSLIAIGDIIQFVRQLDENKYGALRDLLPAEGPPPYLLERINQLIDDRGEIRDKASEALFTIRTSIRQLEAGIERRIYQTLVAARKESIVASEAEVTIRNGRLVIPVPAGNKRKMRGFIHDTSATGQTVYIEPAEIFETNNEIQNLLVEEKQEIVRILTEFADLIRPEADGLVLLYDYLGTMDFIRAKGKLAMQMDAYKPQLHCLPLIKWLNAVHPLLDENLKKQGRKIVAQDIVLEGDERILIISGPNAGGKSVSLKTVALLQYMLQCGLLIPIKEYSDAGIFRQIFLEIGDEQSLENDLSTYSSHLLHIKHFITHADKNTLILIDEFGGGTEPHMGGALAEATLQVLADKGAWGVITTHYANLKLLAGKIRGIVNGAMLYNTQKMEPMFRLEKGRPGSSFAFEIARNIGFPEDIMEKAVAITGHEQLDYEKLLADIDTEKKELALQKAALDQADKALADIFEKYRQLSDDLETRKSAILREARQKAQQILDGSNKAIEKAVRDIRESKADRKKIAEVRKEVETWKEEISRPAESELPTADLPDLSPAAVRTEPAPSGPLKTGSWVKMEGQTSVGRIVEIKGKQAVVEFDSVKMRTGTDRLVHATYAEMKLWNAGKSYPTSTNLTNRLQEKIAEFRMSIDLRGYKAEEARDAIVKYIDQAVLLRVPEVRILHGKGTGALRNLLHDYLRDVPEVRFFEDESLERGGHGVTVVHFK